MHHYQIANFWFLPALIYLLDFSSDSAFQNFLEQGGFGAARVFSRAQLVAFDHGEERQEGRKGKEGEEGRGSQNPNAPWGHLG